MSARNVDPYIHFKEVPYTHINGMCHLPYNICVWIRVQNMSWANSTVISDYKNKYRGKN
jgi:hypothetical protein